jgi:hypothetical protein
LLLRQRHWLLRLLSLRAVVNRSTLYELKEGEPVMIPLTDAGAETALVVTNGFHSSETVKLEYAPASTYFFQVNAVVNNAGLVIALVLSLLFFALYAFTGSTLMLVVANLPVLVLVWLFFLQPSRAIVLKPWQPEVAGG